MIVTDEEDVLKLHEDRHHHEDLVHSPAKRARYGMSIMNRAAGGRTCMLKAAGMLISCWAAPAHLLPSLVVVDMKSSSAERLLA
jgi:hypothetical protein